MATDLEDKRLTPDADANDPYNREQRAFSDEDRQAFGGEIDEDNFAKDGVSGDLNGGRGTESDYAASSGELRNAEGSKPLQASDPVNPGGGPGGGLFTDGDEPAPSKRGWRQRLLPVSWSRRRKGVVGGLIGLTMGGGVFFGLGIGSGPLQVIHLGEVLHTSFSKNEFDTSVRTRGLFGYSTRFARAGGSGNIGETRVGLLGSKTFGKTMTDLKAIGIEIETGKYGQPTKTTINMDKLKSKYPQITDMNDASRKAFIADKLGVTVDSVNGRGARFNIDQGSMNMKASRLLAGNSVRLLENGKIASSIKTRIVTKYWDLPSLFHPFKKIKAALTKKYVNGQPISQERAEEAQAADDEEEARRRVTESASGGGAAAETERAKSKLGGKVTKVLTIDGYACAARDVVEEIPKINRARIVLPAAATAFRMMAAGSQNKAGQDISLAQDGALVKSLTDKNGTTVWQSLPLAVLAGGSTKGLKDLDPGQKQAFGSHKTVNTIDRMITDTLGGNTAADIRCNKVVLLAEGGGVLLIAGAQIVGTGGAATPVVLAEFAAKQAVQYAASTYAMSFITKLVLNKGTVDALAKDAFSGENGGGLLAYGAQAGATIVSVGTGAVDLGANESAALNKAQAEQSRKEFQSQSMFARIFDITDYRSLTGRLADSISPSAGNNITRFASSFMHIGSSLPNAFASLSPTAWADGDTNYKWVANQYGIPNELLNDPRLSNPYDNADKLAAVLDTGGGDLVDKAKNCFGVTIAKDSDGLWDTMPITDSTVDPESNEYHDAHCNDLSNLNWRRTIMFVFDSNTMKGNACYLGDDKSCEDLGASAGGDTSDTSGGATTFSVASYNMCHELIHDTGSDACPARDTKVTSISKLIGQTGADNKPAFDIVAAQELSQPTQANVLGNIHQYQSFPAKVAANNGLAVIWNTSKFQFVKGDYLGGVVSNSGLHLDGQPVQNNTHPPGEPWVQLKDLASGRNVFVMSIHSPNNGNGSAADRNANAAVFSTWAKSKTDGNSIVIIAGDFNSTGTVDGGKPSAYCIISSQTKLQNAFDIQTSSVPAGTECPTKVGGKIPIDQIYASGDLGLQASGLTRLDNDPGLTGTDHGPAYVTFSLGDTTAKTTGGTPVPYKNPVFGENTPDPSVIRADDGTYHVYTTGRGLQHLTSPDLVHWKRAGGQIITGAPGTATGDTWAPDVQKTNDHYTMTWAGRSSSSGAFSIYYGTSKTAAGPFKYGGRLIPPGYLSTYSLDPNIYMSDAGPILYYGSGGKGITAVKLNIAADGTITTAGPETVLFAANPSTEWIAEGAWLQKHGSYYYMYYSIGRFDFAEPSVPAYAVHVRRSTSPLGPFTEQDPNPVIQGDNKTVSRPGHNSIALDNAGNEWMVYHAYVGNDHSNRKLMIDPITYGADGWPIINGGYPSLTQQASGPVVNKATTKATKK